MRVVFFCHSVQSDWNNGNAHFQRGIMAELARRGHSVGICEPRDAWSAVNLVADAGQTALDGFRACYPQLSPYRYESAELDLDAVLDGAELVIVHEWTPPDLVARLGRHRLSQRRYRLLFHDTHHRMATAPGEMTAYDFSHYDGILAFGGVLQAQYERLGWGGRAWTWHEAADTSVFYPRVAAEPRRDLVWVGNWGDDERSRELSEFLIEPARTLGLRARVHGVRYTEAARAALARGGIEYGGWLPNYRVPNVFGEFRVTVHVPRRPYAEALPGIPTIRPFEALACGIPLVSAPWRDTESLFTIGRDFLMARDQGEMTRMLRALLEDEAFASALAQQGLTTIRTRHTCWHRVNELLAICRVLGMCGSEVSAPNDEPYMNTGVGEHDTVAL